jgi:hypothetical protein
MSIQLVQNVQDVCPERFVSDEDRPEIIVS